MALFVIILSVLANGIALLSAVSYSYGCSVSSKYKPPTLAEEANRARIIFIGTVLEEGFRQKPSLFRVEEVLKGEKLPSAVGVKGFGSGADCVTPSPKGARLLVFVRRDWITGEFELSYSGPYTGANQLFGDRDRQMISELRQLLTEEKRERRRVVDKDIGEEEMVRIPEGEFWMGSDDGEVDEKPRRRVDLNPFSIDKYEVTNTQWEKFMSATGRVSYLDASNPRFPKFSAPGQPVVGVSWHDAEAYCKWGRKRLPTEAEWEKAARGADGRKYPWGDGEPDKTKANFLATGLGKTDVVGSYPAGVSPYGVYDMAGNVWEWVSDWYQERYYQTAPAKNPKGPSNGKFRVLRGGSWESGSEG
jgi:hypothetical protein